MKNAPDYENNLVFSPKSADDLNEQRRESDVIISAIEKCEKLEAENKEFKTRLYNICLVCQKPFKEDNYRVLIDRLAYILRLSCVFKEKELDK